MNDKAANADELTFETMSIDGSEGGKVVRSTLYNSNEILL